MTWHDDATIYTAIEHLSLEATAQLVIAHEDARGAADVSPDSYADTIPVPSSAVSTEVPRRTREWRNAG
jgi:hypothetical protein